MTIKLMVSDIDGTLLDDQGRVHPKTIESIQALEKHDIHFALATGRSYEGAKSAFNQLGLDPSKHELICLNGLRTYTAEGTLLHQLETMSYEACQSLAKIGHEFYQGVMYCFDDAVYFEMDHRSYEDFLIGLAENNLHYFQVDTDTHRIDSIEAIKDRFDRKDPLVKMVFFQTPSYTELVLPRIKKLIPSDAYDIMLVGKGWAEIMPKHVTKGVAIQALAQSLGTSMDHVMVFGDAENDISMFKMAHTGVAMENALESVKTHADRLTQSNNLGGVGLEIERYLNKKEA